ncbi:MAG: hypothetical protein M1368_12570, partial [Thaumarchaeota archaeon]|nr:hypothetical protein [Nitrososphaerota archaeon]
YISTLEMKNNSTGSQELVISSLNKWFASNGIPSKFRFKGLRSRPGKKRFILSKTEVQRLVAFADLPAKVMILLGLSTLLSLSEIRKIRVGDLAKIQLTEEAKSHVEAYLRLRRSRGEVVNDESFVIGLAVSTLSIHWKDSLTRAGIQRPYSFLALKNYVRAWCELLGVDFKQLDHSQIMPVLTVYSDLDVTISKMNALQDRISKLELERNEFMTKYHEQRKMNRELVRKRP